MRAKFFSDARRVVLLLWNIVRWFGPYYFLRLLRLERDKPAFGRRFRMLVERMGVTYVKLGQYLAMRYDLFSPETCAELSKLMSDVRPVPFQVVRERVANELGGPLSSFFLEFDTEPLAAASIAQVHRAIARDGMKLAVKIQHPGIEEDLLADLRNLRRIASLITRFGLAHSVPLVRLVEELGVFTLREVDFLKEADTADRIRRESPPDVKIPRIRWDLTTRGVLSMEYVEGVSLLEVCQLAESGHPEAFEALIPGVEPKELVGRLARACLSQEYVTGRFHGDPHPANILICKDGTIAFVDFGIFGELSLAQRRLLAQYALNIASGNFSQAFRHFEELISYGTETDVTGFRDDIIASLKRWFTASSNPHAAIAEKLGARFQIEILGIMRRHHVRVHPDQALFWRTQAVLDATAHRLPVEFDLLGTVATFLRSPLVANALGYDKVENDTLAITLGEYVTLLNRGPQLAGHVAADMVSGILGISSLGRPCREAERYENSITKALTAAVAGAGLILLAGVVAGWNTGSWTFVLEILLFAFIVWASGLWHLKR